MIDFQKFNMEEGGILVVVIAETERMDLVLSCLVLQKSNQGRRKAKSRLKQKQMPPEIFFILFGTYPGPFSRLARAFLAPQCDLIKIPSHSRGQTPS